jgi:hypothetical protein
MKVFPGPMVRNFEIFIHDFSRLVQAGGISKGGSRVGKIWSDQSEILLGLRLLIPTIGIRPKVTFVST